VAAAIDERGLPNVAAVMLEVNAGTNGISKNFWPAVRRETRKRGVYCSRSELSG